MAKSQSEPKKHLGESIRQKLKNLAKERLRPFDEILRYYAMERFLYRLSISSYAHRFFLKGGLMLKVWDEFDHRATMDIDLLARISNQPENLKNTIAEVALISYPTDAILFDTQNLILRETQTGGDYQGVSASFVALLHTSRIPLLVDIGFNDLVIPQPQKIHYPTLLEMATPQLWGYNAETVVAEKFESIVKLALINTRMKDFYDLWSLCRRGDLDSTNLLKAIQEVFKNRGTPYSFPPVAFTPIFYEDPLVQRRWRSFLEGMGKKDLELKIVITEVVAYLEQLF